jgi:hypothetical protein
MASNLRKSSMYENCAGSVLSRPRPTINLRRARLRRAFGGRQWGILNHQTHCGYGFFPRL